MSGQISEFHTKGCNVLGISTDDVETHCRWLTMSPADGGLGPIGFPLASDTDGAVCTQYGVYLERQRVAHRGLFIMDPNGVLQYQVVHSLSVGRSSEELIRVLDALQSGGLCPGERQPGEAPIDLLSVIGPNRIVGSYQIEKQLGRGTFGKVFLARDLLLDRQVALKVLRPSDRIPAGALLAEARAAAAFSHPNVCAVYAVDNTKGAEMIVMEYVQGESLSSRLESHSLSAEEVAHFTRQIAQGMAAAHSAGVVHGDLKPGNLMVTPDAQIKIMDFGLARRILPTRWQAETLDVDHLSGSGLFGTPSYMAPELARGEFSTPASDVFTLGLILCEMLTGTPVISGDSLLAILRDVDQFEIPPYVATFPQPFGRICQECLAADPAARQITMAQIADMLA